MRPVFVATDHRRERGDVLEAAAQGLDPVLGAVAVGLGLRLHGRSPIGDLDVVELTQLLRELGLLGLHEVKVVTQNVRKAAERLQVFVDHGEAVNKRAV